MIHYECKITILQHNAFKYGVAKNVGSSDLTVREKPALRAVFILSQRYLIVNYHKLQVSAEEYLMIDFSGSF